VNRFISLCCWLFLVTGVLQAQSLEKRALKNIRKGKWDKAASLLTKAVTRDSSGAIAEYGWSRYYFDKRNPRYNIVYAYNAVNESLENFRRLNSRQREKISRFPLDSLVLVRLRGQIDSVSFGLARLQNTEEGYIQFLQRHPFSSDRKTAEQLRNAVAFLDAANQNTFRAFKTFLEKYPDANEKNDARARYERLLFEEKTRDRRLASFESFLKEYPETPFRKEIEKDIFELFTLSGEVERFMSYLKLYPESPFQKRATNILFHVLNDGDDSALSGLELTDSLENVFAANQGYLVPFLKRGKFGFMNNKGFEVIPPSFDDLSGDYVCGNITEDLLVFSDRVVNRTGSVIFRGKIQEVADLGSGFLKIKTEQCSRVVHKSGFILDSCVLDAKMIDKRFVAIQSSKGWSMRSLSGRFVLSEFWDEINLYGKIIVLTKDHNHILFTSTQLADLAHEQEFSTSIVVDQLKLLNNGMLWVSAGGLEAVYDQNLKEIVPLNDYKIQQYFAGFIIRTPEGFSIYDDHGGKSSFFENVMVKDPVIIVTKNNDEYIYDPTQQKLASSAYDSIAFEGSFMKGWRTDSVFIQFQAERRAFSASSKTAFISGKDSTAYILVEADGKKIIFDNEGMILFTLPSPAFESIQHDGGDFFIVSKKDKKGLIDKLGKVVLPIEYDAIGPVTNQTISVLKAGHFGLLNTASRKLIKPQYEKNIIAYKNNLLVVFKDGRHGFIDWENKAQSKAEFEEVKYWNDSVALVKKNKLWEMLDLFTGKTLLTDIREITPIRETANEKLFIMNQNNLFGVVSSLRGKIIPFSFSDLVNVGSTEEPLYFTEKHVSEASVFVVIYYDRNGHMLRREVYEESEDYEKIYCRQN
jgi:tetratricopeptide (TPR) repeat protein